MYNLYTPKSLLLTIDKDCFRPNSIGNAKNSSKRYCLHNLHSIISKWKTDDDRSFMYYDLVINGKN